MDISVIVPLYKGNKYISDIVNMVEKNYTYAMSQGMKLEIEVVFINDYPDEKLEEVSSRFVGVRYSINENNSGIHQTRINGIKLSTATYIHMLDQDDSISEDFYFSQMATNGSADVVVCNGIYRGKKLIFEETVNSFNKEDLINKGNKIVSPGQTLVKKSAIPDAWYENPVQISGCDDWLLWILMVYENASFAYNPNISYIHVEDGNNQSFHWDKMSASLKEIKEILSKQNAEDALKEQSLKCIDKFIYDYDSFYAFEKEWNSIDREQIRRFLDTNKIHTVAIYGYGNIGRKIVATLKDCGVNIWAIDRDLRYVDEDIAIYRPDDELPQADLMVVTPLRGADEIKLQMSKCIDANCICTVKEFFEK